MTWNKVNQERFTYSKEKTKYGLLWIFIKNSSDKQGISYKHGKLRIRLKVRHPRIKFTSFKVELNFRYEKEYFVFPIKQIMPSTVPEDGFHTITYSCTLPEKVFNNSYLYFTMHKPDNSIEGLFLFMPKKA
jgi:hypothetical protein